MAKKQDFREVDSRNGTYYFINGKRFTNSEYSKRWLDAFNEGLIPKEPTHQYQGGKTRAWVYEKT